MPAPKRRKVSTIDPSSSRGGLDAFTKATKRRAATSKSFSEKAAASPEFEVEERVVQGKRKIVEKSDSEIEGEEDVSITAGPAGLQRRDIRPLPTSRRSQRAFETPKKPASPPTPTPIEETPTTKALGLFSRFAVSKSSPTQWDSSPLRQDESSVFDSSQDLVSSQLSVDQGIPDDDESLPIELSDLINLNASFLNALSLHYAHNGTHTPADVQKLCPSTALNWGKRSVTLLDIQRALGIQNMSTDSLPSSQSARSPTLTLSNYGSNKICIEIETTGGKKGVMARPLDEQMLGKNFSSNLMDLWKQRCHSSEAETETTIAKFINSLPLQPIPNNSANLETISPTLTKGARRLADLKASQALKKQTLLAPFTKDTSSTTPKKESPLKRGSSLLDRIRAKSLAAANLPPPLTKTELLRISALHRLPEVIQILTLLSTSGSAGQSRVSFTMGTILGKLKDSCRGEIAMDEGRMCLEVLESMIAPGWIRIVGGGLGKGGGKGVVVIDRERRPEGEMVEERIKEALASGGKSSAGGDHMMHTNH